MKKPMLGTSSDGRPMHYSVGALIKQGGAYLLFDRVKPTFGYAGPSGHVDENETDFILALRREVQEETGLVVTGEGLLFEEELCWDRCRHGVSVHYWRLYACEVVGVLKPDPDEARNMGWYAPAAENWPIHFEPCWKYWFQKLGVLK